MRCNDDSGDADWSGVSWVARMASVALVCGGLRSQHDKRWEAVRAGDVARGRATCHQGADRMSLGEQTSFGERELKRERPWGYYILLLGVKETFIVRRVI